MVASGGWHCKDLFRGAIISVATAACFFAAFIAAALWLPQDQSAIRRHIVVAVLDGTFTARPNYGPLGATVFPRHTLDCTLANMMRRRPPAASPMPSAPPCRAQSLVERCARAPRQPTARVSRAPFRSWARGMGMCSTSRVTGTSWVSGWSGACCSRLCPSTRWQTCCAASRSRCSAGSVHWRLLRLRAAPGAASRRFATGYLIITLCLALLYGVHYFDAMLYFAPPDHVHFSFIIISLLMPLARMRVTALALYAASYGSLIAIFESLTGGIPFALALLPLLLALGFEGDRHDYLTRLFLLWGAFCIAVVTCFALKKIMAIAFLGDQESFASLLFYRMFGAPLPSRARHSRSAICFQVIGAGVH